MTDMTAKTLDEAFQIIEDQITDQIERSNVAQAQRVFELIPDGKLDVVYKFPYKMTEEQKAQRDARNAARTFVRVETEATNNWGAYDAVYTIDHKACRVEARREAKGFCDGAKAKVVAKLGDFQLERAVVSVTGNMTITGQKSGHQIELVQTQKWVSGRRSKWGGWGRSFVQFPALLYVDGQFTKAAAFEAACA